MTGGLLDRATREASERLHCTGPRSAPQYRAEVYAKAILRVVESERREGEDFYDAYLRVRARPSAVVVALVVSHRAQFGREHPPVMH